MAIAEGFRGLTGISLDNAGVLVGKAHGQKMDLALNPSNDGLMNISSTLSDAYLCRA